MDNFSLLFSAVCIIIFSGQLIITLRTAIERFQKINLAFYFLMLLAGQITAAAVILAGDMLQAGVYYQLYSATATGFIFAFLPLSFSLIEHKNKFPVTVFSIIAFFIHAAINLTFSPFDDFYIGAGGFYVPEVTFRSIGLNIIPLVLFFAGIVHILVFIRHSSSALLRHRLYYFMLATILIFSGLAANLTILKDYPVDVICTMLGGLLLAYAIIRKRLLSISKTFFRGALASTLTAALTGLFTLLLYLTSMLTGHEVSYLSVFPALVCFILTLSILSKRQKPMSRFLFTTDTIYVKSIKRFSEKIGKLQDFHSIFEALYETISDEFNLDQFRIYMIDRTEGELTCVFRDSESIFDGPNISLGKKSPLLLALKYNEILLTDDFRETEARNDVPCRLKDVYGECPPDIILPVKISDEIIGLIILVFSSAQHFLDYEDTGFIQELNRLTTEAVTRAIAFEQLEQEVFKKENLIKDINHRVKNNLQMISGLLALQGMSAGNDDVVSALNTAEQRIRTIAKIHEMLYIRGVVETVNLRLYLTEVLKGFHISDTENHIVIRNDIPNINIDAEKALTICLVVNELVSNAVKYAFTGRSSGTIIVAIRHETETGTICGLISDDGIGYSRSAPEGSGIGHSLVEGLITKQLKGSWKTENADGTTHLIRFPLG